MFASTPTPPPRKPDPRPAWLALSSALHASAGTWFDITDDVSAINPGTAADDDQLRGLVHTINRGTLHSFGPAGAIVGYTNGTRVWAVAVPAGEDPAPYRAQIPGRA